MIIKVMYTFPTNDKTLGFSFQGYEVKTAPKSIYFCESVEPITDKYTKKPIDFPLYTPVMVASEDIGSQFLLVTERGEIVYINDNELADWCEDNKGILEKLKTGKGIREFFKI